MTLRFIDCDQNSPEWHQARLGIPTASNFKAIIGIKKDAREKATRALYMRKLAGEIITGEPAESYYNEAMQRGHEMEAEARDAYIFSTGTELTQVGFVTNGIAGCSPDRLIGEDGGLEIKTAAPHILIEH